MGDAYPQTDPPQVDSHQGESTGSSGRLDPPSHEMVDPPSHESMRPPGEPTLEGGQPPSSAPAPTPAAASDPPPEGGVELGRVDSGGFDLGGVDLGDLDEPPERPAGFGLSIGGEIKVRNCSFRPPTHFSHMLHATFPISHI